MSYSKRQLEAFGEPLGDSATYRRPGDGKVVCGSGGGGGGQSSSTSIDPRFNNLIQYATDNAAKINAQGFTPYTEQRYADMNQTQKQGLDMITQRATNGSPVMDAAQQSLTQTIKGGNTNPFLDSMVDRAQQNVTRNFNQATAGSGSFGNSGLSEQAIKDYGGVASQMYGQAYDQDRARQMQGISMAPTFGNQAYQDAAQLMKAGQAVQDQQQQQKDFAYQQFQEQQNLPYKQMAAYQGLLGSGNINSTTTRSSGGK